MENKQNELDELTKELEVMRIKQQEKIAFESKPLPTIEELKAIKAKEDIQDRIKLTEQLLITAQVEQDRAKEIYETAKLKVKITTDILKNLK